MRRDALVIGSAVILSCVIGAWLFYANTFSDTVLNGTEPVTYRVLVEGPNIPTMTERKNLRLNTPEKFQTLWSSMYGIDMPALPSVDFTKNQVLAVFDGSHATGGYSVAVTSIVDSDTTRTITITHTIPSANCMVTESFSSPFQIVIVPRSDKEISRQDVDVVKECN